MFIAKLVLTFGVLGSKARTPTNWPDVSPSVASEPWSSTRRMSFEFVSFMRVGGSGGFVAVDDSRLIFRASTSTSTSS